VQLGEKISEGREGKGNVKRVNVSGGTRNPKSSQGRESMETGVSPLLKMKGIKGEKSRVVT